ncbi:MAG TPA: LPXTG cell wall anchor domain-containing protein [Acidimicrobiales bacterium]|nr:LPXTG cell wall anchor domain-containing protein [Acidimicrobiales bacterium]
MTEDNDTNDNGTPNNVPDAGDNAHPSGNDRSVEHGNSGNQGNAQSDPDGATNGGVDQPDGAGGVDLADQDGNNGCGNDDDFEDDNNGKCGGPDKVGAAPLPGSSDGDDDEDAGGDEPTDEPSGVDADEADGSEVLDATVERGPVEVAAAAQADDEDPGVLPRTGSEIALLTVVGLGLVAGGLVLRRLAARH